MGDQSWSRAAARPTKQRGLAPASTSASSQPTILLSVAGLSPQVVTESLYCLLVVQQPPADVREVRVVTTLAGAERVRRTLLDRRTGHLARFCREYGIPRGRIRFDAACILVPDGADGAPLADVRTPEDNGRMADAILALVRELTADPSRALHGSVAGGRKTMGLFLGIAFQFFARPQDRLSHVLVSPSELEGHPHFFFPPATPTTYQIAGRRVSSRDVRVELAEIPLLRLREQLAGVQLEELSYTELIREAQQELDRRAAPPSLLLRSVDRSLHIGGETVRLTTLEFALYSLLAERRRSGCGGVACTGCPRCSLEATDFLAGEALGGLRASATRLGGKDERLVRLDGWEQDGDKRFLQVRSRINGKIRGSLGRGRWVEPYAIAAVRSPGARVRYVLPIDPGQIGFA